MRKNNAPLRTVDGATLMSQPLHLPNFVVDTLLAQGLHILAGSPKVGKSWLALWLAVTVAKGEPVWNMTTRQGTTLYLCLEDSILRIQNRLFEITEDAPDSVHFCTECALIGQGLEEQVDAFIAAHPDTVLVIIDASSRISYPSLCRQRQSLLITSLLLFRPEPLRWVPSGDRTKPLRLCAERRHSGISKPSRLRRGEQYGACADEVEEKWGSGRARLTCVGRDIEYRELELRRSEENVWELVSDSREEPVLREDRIVVLLSAFMSTRTIFIGTPTELSEKIDPDKSEGITPKKISRLILQSVEALRKIGIQAMVRRSNGKRVIELRRADSVDLEGAREIVPIDPAAVGQPSGEGAAGAVETNSSLRGGQASRPAIRRAQFRGAAPYPAQKRGPHGIEIPWGEEEQRNG